MPVLDQRSQPMRGASRAEASVASDIVNELAPDEADLLSELLKAPWWLDRLRGSSVGFGLTLPAESIAPYVVLGVVWASAVVGGEARTQAEERLRELTRRMLGIKAAEVRAPFQREGSGSDVDQLRSELVQYIVALGMEYDRARVLAEAIVARINRPDN
jgi:hypothetical protein